MNAATSAGLAPVAKVPAPTSPARPLRLGLLVDDLSTTAWAARVLRRVVAEGIATVDLVVVNDATSGAASDATTPAPPRRGLLRRVAAWYRNRDALAYTLYQRIDERRYRRPAAPDDRVELRDLVGDADILHVRPRMTKHCDYVEPADLERIRRYDLDVVLRFGFRILKGDVLGVARHGVWSFHHGDNTVNRGGPAGFWEVMEQHAVTGAVLQRLSENLDGGEILARSFSSTDPFSVTANRANYYWQAAELLAARLRDLAEWSAVPRAPGERFATDDAAPTWSAYTHRLYKRPQTAELVRLWLRLALRLVRSKVRDLFVREQWLLAYRLAPGASPAGGAPDGDFYRFKELQPPPDRFWADPFPVHADGRYYLFFEEFPYAAAHAHISVVEMEAAGPVGAPRVVLQRPYHLSYPAVFRWDGAWYMTPETAARNAVELYRAVDFPDRWEYVGDLVTGVRAVDATIAEIDGRWWMFVGVAVPGATETTALHLYAAPTPLGPWTPHRRNPQKIDVRGGRPGGRVFRHAGRHYRVAQDGAPRYGSGIRVYVIDRIDADEYRETEVERIAPRWRPGLVGMHTLNADGALTAIDLRQVRRRF